MENKKYDCFNCRYRDRTVNFCGFCMQKILDEMNENKKVRGGKGNGENKQSNESS